MPKGNNIVPHNHGRKHWTPCSSQRGNIKVRLAQPKQAMRRRRLRQAKAKKIFPRPLRNLKPQVNCPTIRHNFKKRLGRGFSDEELSAVNLNPKYANTIGICIDHRRKNRSEEGLQANVQRLKTYLSKLVCFPRTKKTAKAAELKNIKQDCTRFATASCANPGDKVKIVTAMRKVTPEEAKTRVYPFLKKNHSAARFMGERMARAAKKEAKKAEK